MQTTTAKRVEILIEAPMESRLTAALTAAAKALAVLPKPLAIFLATSSAKHAVNKAVVADKSFAATT